MRGALVAGKLDAAATAQRRPQRSTTDRTRSTSFRLVVASGHVNNWPVPERYGLAKDIEPAPEDIKVKFRKKKLSLKKRSIEDIDIILRIPEKKEYLNRKFGIVLLTEVKSLDIPIELYSRIYFRIKE